MNITASRKISESAQANEIVTSTVHLRGGSSLTMRTRRESIEMVARCLLSPVDEDPKWVLDVDGRIVRLTAIDAIDCPEDLDLGRF